MNHKQVHHCRPAGVFPHHHTKVGQARAQAQVLAPVLVLVQAQAQVLVPVLVQVQAQAAVVVAVKKKRKQNAMKNRLATSLVLCVFYFSFYRTSLSLWALSCSCFSLFSLASLLIFSSSARFLSSYIILKERLPLTYNCAFIL